MTDTLPVHNVFAQLDDDDWVVNVVLVSDEDMTDANGNKTEEAGIAFMKSLLGEDTKWALSYPNQPSDSDPEQIDTSKNPRVWAACIGGKYDRDNDRFLPLKSFSKWVWDEESYGWVPPVDLSEKDWKPSWDPVNEAWIPVCVAWDDERGDWIKVVWDEGVGDYVEDPEVYG